MAKLRIDTELRDEKGNEIGKNISCLILDADNNFKKDSNGNPLIVEVENKALKKTLKGVICDSLLYENPQTPLTGAEKNNRYKIWSSVNNAKTIVELKSEEITIIKECIGAIQPILIVGQCEMLIEG